MVRALVARDEARAEGLRAKLREIEEDPRERKLDEVRWHAVRFLSGFEGPGIPELERLGEDAAVRGEAYMAIGNCYLNAAQPAEAAEAFRESAESHADGLKRANALARRATALVALGRHSDAVRELEAELREQRDRRAALELWTALAEAYREHQKDQRAFALHKAAELAPNDPRRRFDAAYAATEADSALAPLALHNYLRALRFDPAYSGARNNLGVQLERLGLPILAIEQYQEAFDGGSSLAGANMAYRYLDGGFGKEAEQLLESANSMEDVHENVRKAVGDLAQRRSDQEKRFETLTEEGQRVSTFVGAFAAARVAEVSASFEGEWRFASGYQVELVGRDAQLEGEWQEGSSRQKRQFLGSAHGHAAVGDVRRMGFSFVGDETGWEDPRRIYFVLHASGTTIDFFRLDSDEPTFGQLTRVDGS